MNFVYIFFFLALAEVAFGQGRIISSISFGQCVSTGSQPVVGDDRGGIATDNNAMYYTGDTVTGRFTFADPIVPSALSVQIDGIFSDLLNGNLYTLATDSTTFFSDGDLAVSHIIRINSAGGIVGTATALSNPISGLNGHLGSSLYADEGFVHIRLNSTLYSIDIESGNVSSMDIGVAIDDENYYACENWAQFGFVERIRGVPYLTVICRDYDSADGGPSLCRQNLNTLVLSYLVIGGNDTFAGDACSIALSPITASNPRIFAYHTEGGFSSELNLWCDSPNVEISICGDGIINAQYEDCDDGNTVTGDGCFSCLVEDGYTCKGEPSVCDNGGDGHSSSSCAEVGSIFYSTIV